MEVPFESFFALWDHLNSLSDADAAKTPIDLPAGQDGAILKEGDDHFKSVTSDKAVLLLRFWLDVFKHQWVDDPSALNEKELKLKGAFGYLLRHNPFPAEDNSLAKFTEKINFEQSAAAPPTSRPGLKSEAHDKLKPEPNGQSR